MDIGRERAGVAVYCQHNGELYFLCVKEKRSGFWGFPKGHVKEGESNIQTAIREFKEEVGYNMTRLSEQHFVASTRTYCLFWISELVIPNIKNNPEIEDVAWMTIDYLSNQDISMNTERLISGIKKMIPSLNPKEIVRSDILLGAKALTTKKPPRSEWLSELVIDF